MLLLLFVFVVIFWATLVYGMLELMFGNDWTKDLHDWFVCKRARRQITKELDHFQRHGCWKDKHDEPSDYW
jgi:hypothetical protein